MESPDAFQKCPDGRRTTGTPVGRFKRNYNEVRGAQCRVAGQGHSRRTIQENVVVFRKNFSDCVGKCRVEPLFFPLLTLGKVLAGELSGHWNDVNEFVGRFAN